MHIYKAKMGEEMMKHTQKKSSTTEQKKDDLSHRASCILNKTICTYLKYANVDKNLKAG